MDLTRQPGPHAAGTWEEPAPPAAGEEIIFVLAAPVPSRPGPVYLLHPVGGVGCVLGYTDLERLVACCGPHQPWLAVPLGTLMPDLREQRLPGPVVNLPLAPGARWTAEGPPVDLAAISARGAGGRGAAPEESGK